MNPTQPKDAEMDEKKFPPRRFIDKNDSCYVGVYAYDFHIRKEGRTWDEYLSLEEHEAILSEERARLAKILNSEEYKKLIKDAARAATVIQCWKDGNLEGAIDYFEALLGTRHGLFEANIINDKLQKLKSQPTEDKSGVGK